MRYFITGVIKKNNLDIDEKNLEKSFDIATNADMFKLNKTINTIVENM